MKTIYTYILLISITSLASNTTHASRTVAIGETIECAKDLIGVYMGDPSAFPYIRYVSEEGEVATILYVLGPTASDTQIELDAKAALFEQDMIMLGSVDGRITGNITPYSSCSDPIGDDYDRCGDGSFIVNNSEVPTLVCYFYYL
ncbi:MAG: hypothetical protein ISR65_11245 [Bacteriovoracaceae bacterium]|nr:hypothetical protein [Bacteriovoracaceae bacterium]